MVKGVACGVMGVAWAVKSVACGVMGVAWAVKGVACGMKGVAWAVKGLGWELLLMPNDITSSHQVVRGLSATFTH